jgi:MarR family transcriptional regulator, temperature-dependent positive regulator of motility
MLIISMLVNSRSAFHPALERSVRDNNEMPGHLARRFQQIAVAVFLAEVEDAGFDLTPVQYAALSAIKANPGIDQVTLAGLIAYDRTTITGVVDRLVQKDLLVRNPSSRDRRARELQITDAGKRTLRGITPAVEAAQRSMLRGLTEKESADLMRLLRKAIAAGNELSRAPLRDTESR